MQNALCSDDCSVQDSGALQQCVALVQAGTDWGGTERSTSPTTPLMWRAGHSRREQLQVQAWSSGAPETVSRLPHMGIKWAEERPWEVNQSGAPNTAQKEHGFQVGNTCINCFGPPWPIRIHHIQITGLASQLVVVGISNWMLWVNCCGLLLYRTCWITCNC